MSTLVSSSALPTAKVTTDVRRVALLIGNPGIGKGGIGEPEIKVEGTDKDLASLSGVLGDPEFGGFETKCLRNPTLIEARKAIALVARNLRPTDTILVYYTGASAIDSESRLYLPVSDSSLDFMGATCLDSDYILSCLRHCESRAQILIIDGCNSGALFNGNRGIPDGICAIASCGPEEVSWDDSEGGFFTKLLVEGLTGAAADADGDGVVTTDELFRFVKPRALSAERPTTPQMWTWNLSQAIPLVSVRRRVFLSYNHADAPMADIVVNTLRNAGYGVFVDRENISGGVRWRERTESELGAADTVVFLMSKGSLDSDEVYKELKHAIDLKRTIIPLRLDGSRLSGWYTENIGPLHHIDAVGEHRLWWPQLLAALRHPSAKRPPQDATNAFNPPDTLRQSPQSPRPRNAGPDGRPTVARPPPK